MFGLCLHVLVGVITVTVTQQIYWLNAIKIYIILIIPIYLRLLKV